MNLSFILTDDDTLSIIAKGKNYTIPPSHKFYDEIWECIKNNDADGLIKLADIKAAVTTYSKGNIEIKNETIHYKGEVVENELTRRILEMMKKGFPFDSMLLFLNNLMENPSYQSRSNLYRFLQHRGMPITEDGCFLGYKAIRENWHDIHSGKFDNSVGRVVTMERAKVDDNFNNACSAGLHVGSIDYARTFGRTSPNSRIVIVKVNPKDAVSVPHHEDQKLRCCAYEVVSIYEGELDQAPVYTSCGQPSSPSWSREDDEEDYDDEDESWHDDDEYDDEDDESCY